LINGIADFNSLVPPVIEQGDIPAVEPATPAVKGQLTLGAKAVLATQSIDAAGGTIKVSSAGDPLDGLTIMVPAGTYDKSVSFSVSESSIGPAASMIGITPISPLISIDNGGVPTAGDPVQLTVPVSVPAGATVLGLYYHGAAGTIDPLPIVAQDANSVTLAAAHFSDIFLAIQDMSKFPTTVDSGFRPGVDDWQFPNYGSYAAPKGQCEGQTDSEIWYYEYQRQGAGASPLHGVYDNNGAPDKTPTFWQDDSDGYRFVASIQADALSNPAVFSKFGKLNRNGTLTYNLLKAAIGLTGEPQELDITDAAGGSFHAIVVYRVSPTRVYVADPNYPARLRTIPYDAASGVLGPYSSGDSAGSIASAGTVSYTRFAYVPAQAAASADNIAAHWAEFEANKAGDAVFPAYSLEVMTGKDAEGNEIWKPLDKTYETSEDQIQVRMVVPAGGSGTMQAYLGTTVQPGSWGTEQTVDLKDGVNDLGLYEMGVAGGDWKYVNFTRVAVTKGLMDINGSWSGTLTFTDISVDAAAQKEAEDQGCDIAIIEALKDQELPLSLTLTADKEGKGQGIFLIDTSKINLGGSDPSSTPSPPKPTTLALVYAKGVITFDFGDQCSGSNSTCSMEGTPSVVAGVDTIAGTLKVGGAGYSAVAEWTVTRDR
jgi:hypothetical protein